jgi:hypothetical protein
MGIMNQDRNSIRGKVDVGFDGRDAQIESDFESGQGIFGLQTSGTTVTLEIKGRRLPGCRHEIISTRSLNHETS